MRKESKGKLWKRRQRESGERLSTEGPEWTETPPDSPLDQTLQESAHRRQWKGKGKIEDKSKIFQRDENFEK